MATTVERNPLTEVWYSSSSYSGFGRHADGTVILLFVSPACTMFQNARTGHSWSLDYLRSIGCTIARDGDAPQWPLPTPDARRVPTTVSTTTDIRPFLEYTNVRLTTRIADVPPPGGRRGTESPVESVKEMFQWLA
jgi:hypothetical protein